ncbi:MAG: hypothetical protein JGK21_05230 [Microcoleus sp. PH2017_22_RUC_O_B]|uniref:hypothetical protein n=1 Tax=unclassified Microcoleus TaxID=2642155 RepID=UPI001DAB6067|nr:MULTISPECIES: hypothetical protein [unclassified Microcoleus]MCC3527683.1 hypothetical protein [Microcoleus sp. PH2017_21_RUC_O_A]MCC3539785.1 hypothetical protein [Microcoleus sp. PH2017_22_RUC_O_B]
MRVGDRFNRGIIEEAIAFDLEECDRLFYRNAMAKPAAGIAQKCHKFLFLAIANPHLFHITEIRPF